jgi:hypothetical protein
MPSDLFRASRAAESSPPGDAPTECPWCEREDGTHPPECPYDGHIEPAPLAKANP